MPKLTTLSQMRSVAEKVSSFIGSVIQTVVDALEEIENSKADKSESVSITIPTSGWKSDSTVSDYPYYYDLTASNVIANDCISIMISPSSQQTAMKCGMCPTNESFAGVIRIRSTNIPSSTILAQYWIEQGKEN